MKSEDLPKLQEALQKAFPEVEVLVRPIEYGRRFHIGTDNMALRPDERIRFGFESPENMDYTALSFEEWLHRATTTLTARLRR